MTWFAALSLLRRVPSAVWLALASLGLLAGAYSWAYQRGAHAGRAACEAKRAAEVVEAVAQAERNALATHEARERMLVSLGWSLPKIEARTHDTVIEIRTIYKDRPVPAECVRPEPVRRLLQAAVDQANTAASGL